MDTLCVACTGWGYVLDEVCPLCEGNPRWAEAQSSSDVADENFPRAQERCRIQSLDSTVSTTASDANERSRAVSLDSGFDTTADTSADIMEDEDSSAASSRENDQPQFSEELGFPDESEIRGFYQDIIPTEPEAQDTSGSSGAQGLSSSESQDSNAQDAAAQVGGENAVSANEAGEATHTGLLLVSDGFFRFTLLVPMLQVRPSFTEEEVAKIGMTWTHGDSQKFPPLGDSPQMDDEGTDTNDDDSIKNAHETCAICMESFDQGEKLTALPCAHNGCSSVWHLQCIHKWLNNTPSCPLCRAEIRGSGAETVSRPSPTIAFMGSNTENGSGFSHDLMGMLFQGMLQAAARSQGSNPRMLAGLNSRIDPDDELSATGEISLASVPA